MLPKNRALAIPFMAIAFALLIPPFIPVGATHDGFGITAQDDVLVYTQHLDDTDVFLKIVNTATEARTLRLDLTNIASEEAFFLVLLKHWDLDRTATWTRLFGSLCNTHTFAVDSVHGSIRAGPQYKELDMVTCWMHETALVDRTWNITVLPGKHEFLVAVERASVDLNMFVASEGAEAIDVQVVEIHPDLMRFRYSVNPQDWDEITQIDTPVLHVTLIRTEEEIRYPNNFAFLVGEILGHLAIRGPVECDRLTSQGLAFWYAPVGSYTFEAHQVGPFINYVNPGSVSLWIFDLPSEWPITPTAVVCGGGP